MLTKRLIDAAKYEGEERSRHVLWDHETKGLGLRVYPPTDGAPSRKTFVLSYRIGSRKRLLTLGDYGTLTLDQARDDARDRLREVKREGRDPLAEKKAGRAANSVAELIEIYIERHAKATKRTWKEDERVLLKDVKPKLGHLKIGEVKRADVIDVLDGITDRAPVAAARTFEIVRKMFNFAIQRGLIEQSPCHRIASPAKGAPRARILTPAEIKTLWDGLDNEDLRDSKGLPIGVGRPLRLAIRLLLLTAQRRGELAKAEWRNLDLDMGVWVVPSEDAKNEREHRVPLATEARQALKELRRIVIDREQKRAEAQDRRLPADYKPVFVLPNPSGDGPIKARSITHAYGRICKALKLAGITVHDLRRSAATGLAEQKVPRLVIGKILNHTDKGVTAVYERYEYADEIREALDRWARQVRKLTTSTPTRATGRRNVQ